MITITFKNNKEDNWKDNEWDDYSYEGPIFVIKKDKCWIGIYNMSEVRSIIVT